VKIGDKYKDLMTIFLGNRPHLDVDKRRALFDLIRTSGIQAWMAGTDAADFQGLAGFATMLEITGGMVQMC
jgi:recombinational DNA repair ATPase RecF